MPQEITKFYRNIVLLFIFVAILLTGGIFYLNYNKAVITINPSVEESQASMIVDIKEFPFEPQELGENEIDGKIYEIVKEKKLTVKATGAKKIESDTIGKVTIINNYSKEQVLIATTRLLSSEGVLLRTKNDVTAPKGGKVSVEVYPDNADTFSVLEPTKFTIPGLWSGLQEHIYGESYEKFITGGFKVKVVSEEDLNLAEKQLKEEAYQEVLQEIDDQLSADEKLFTKVVMKEVVEKFPGNLVGQELDEFEYNIKLKMFIVVFDEKKLVSLVETRLSQDLPPGEKLFGLDTSSLSYSYENYDPVDRVVNLKVEASGLSTLSAETGIFNKQDLTGKSIEEVNAYFSQFSEIKNVEVKLSPGWVKKMPSSADRIEIQIK